MSTFELEQALWLGLCLWLRVWPLFVVLPYLALGAAPVLLGTALSLGFACVATPLCSTAHTVAAPILVSTALSELLRGGLIALGCGLPFAALRSTGAIVAGLVSGETALGAAAVGGGLARMYGLAGSVVAVGADGLCGAFRLVLDVGTLPALGTSAIAAEPERLRVLLLAACEHVWRAFTLGVDLSAPFLLGVIVAAALVGLLARLAPAAPVQPLNTVLWPWLGLALVSLTLADTLAVVPDLVRGFAQSTARLLTGMP
jgi:flagellar biosynthesis protein FliR